MVVFADGRPDRAAYRRYRVKTVQGVDDYGSMREILGRRLRRGLAEGTLPDLLVVDGGHGQVSAARAVLADLGLDTLPVIGLVKPRTERAHGQREALDRIVLPAIREPLRLKAAHPALRLLQHLRDESHATAVHYHRKVRGKRALQSALEALPGVGTARRTALLRHFGSARRVAEASLEELTSAPGIGPALASRIHAALHPHDPEG
jgi:excinuclease ABC subunit C